MPSIWGSDAGGAWRLLAPSQYPADQVLHDLVEQAPQMLPLAGSPQITILGREVQLGAGRADLVAVESSGRLTIIEIKLTGNAEARRAVVAQVLSYAAYMQGLTPVRLESEILGAHLQEPANPPSRAHTASWPSMCTSQPAVAQGAQGGAVAFLRR